MERIVGPVEKVVARYQIGDLASKFEAEAGIIDGRNDCQPLERRRIKGANATRAAILGARADRALFDQLAH